MGGKVRVYRRSGCSAGAIAEPDSLYAATLRTFYSAGLAGVAAHLAFRYILEYHALLLAVCAHLRILMCAVAAATAVALNLQRVEAFSPRSRPAARLATEFLPVQVQPDGLFRGVGVVTAIDPATGSLTTNHQEIVGLMPPMEMLFHVDPRNLSEGVKPGDKIEFGVEG
jgi:Cu/Ag efflux protein CusF